MADYDFAIIDDCIEQGGTTLNDFFRWGTLIENSAILWKYTLREKKGNEKAEAFYNYFRDEMHEEAEMLKTADDIKKFAISKEFKLLKHEDKVEIVKSVQSEIPDEFKKFRKMWRSENPNKLL